MYVAGELDEKDQQEVLETVRTSPRCLKYFMEMQASVKAADYFGSERSYDIDRVRAKMNKRIHMDENRGKADYRILFRVAASLLLLVSLFSASVIVRGYRTSQFQSEVYQTIESPIGSRTRVYLPDSTFVVLNAGSTLRYPIDYLTGEEREVSLSGEGFFDVRKRKGSTFIVRVGDIELTALGTSFNVKAYPEEELIETTLVEGLLRIERGDSKKGAVYLRSNEKLSIVKDGSGMKKSTVNRSSGDSNVQVHDDIIKVRELHVEKLIDPVTEISWKDSLWVIRRKNMAELAVMLERRYNVEIVLGDDEVGNFFFSGTLKDETLEQLLYAVRSTAPIDYTVDGDRVVLTQNEWLKKQYRRMLNNSNEPTR